MVKAHAEGMAGALTLTITIPTPSSPAIRVECLLRTWRTPPGMEGGELAVDVAREEGREEWPRETADDARAVAADRRPGAEDVVAVPAGARPNAVGELADVMMEPIAHGMVNDWGVHIVGCPGDILGAGLCKPRG